MQSITGLYSSVYLTALGMNTRRHYDDPFDGERPVPASLFARITSRFFLVISRMRELSRSQSKTFWPIGSSTPPG